MPPRGAQRGGVKAANPPRRDADLSSVLTATHKAELMAIVMSITEAMQQQIFLSFKESSQQSMLPAFSKMSPNMSSSTTLAVSSEKLAHHTGRGVPRIPGVPIGRSSVREAARKPFQADNCENEPLEDTKATVGSQTELKKEALEAFSKWQEAVLMRIGEITVANDTPPQPPPSSGRGPGGRPAGRGAGRPPDRLPLMSSGKLGSQMGRHNSLTGKS